MIPKLLHRIWVGSEMPEEFIEYGRTWMEHHPTWLHALWTDQDQPPMSNVIVKRIDGLELWNKETYDAAPRLAPKNVGQFRADVLRYEILLRQGGVYVDADFECMKPIDPLLTEKVHAFAAWEREAIWLNNAILGSEPGDQFIASLVQNLANSVKQNKGMRPNVMTGPQYMTRCYRAAIRSGRPTLTTLPRKYFYPYLWNELDKRGQLFPDAYAVHHWNNRRRSS